MNNRALEHKVEKNKVKMMKVSGSARWISLSLTMVVVGLLTNGLPGSSVLAAETGGEPKTADSAAQDGGAVLVEKLRALRPDIPIERVSPSPLPGIFMLELSGGTVFYGTADGRYLFAGDLYELQENDLVNLAEVGRIEKRHELMAAVKKSDMVIFPATVKTKAVISVFTDVDCGYCRKLHQEVPRLNELGIEVRYLAYPRAGIGSLSYQKIVSAWCSANPNAAITALKSGAEIPDATCPNPVASQFELGHEVGVTGTPSIVLEDGRLLPGYVPADELASTLGI